MSDFTAEQRVAIEARAGSFALAAGAGSGKTSVLVERYVGAIEDGVAPSSILAITFTDRAAGELRERVRARLVGLGRRDAARESAGAYVTTFHGFAIRLLRSHAMVAGLAADFGVLGDAQAATLRERAFDRALTSWIDGDGALDLAASFEVGSLREAIFSAFDQLRSRGERAPALPVPRPRHDLAGARERLARAAATLAAELEHPREALGECARIASELLAHSPDEVSALKLRIDAPEYEAARAAYEEACADHLGVPAVASLDRLLGAFSEAYAALKRRAGMVDFDDIELEALALLQEHEEIRVHWRERFALVMVDELQDTNGRQMALVEALGRENVFTVGDEFQSIYGFRNADVELFRARHAALAPGGATGVLSANFRSRPPLLAATGAVFAGRFGSRFEALLAGRDPLPDGEPLIELIVADLDGWDEHEERLGIELAPAPIWRRAEARLLAHRIDELIGSGVAAEDIVVLLRAATSIGTYEAALADLGHATLATAGGGFFERAEVIDLVAYVQALANPLDALALYGVLASPLCGADSDTLAALALSARQRGCAVWDVLEAAPPDARTAAFTARLVRAREAAADRSLAGIVTAAVAENGYDLHLAALHAPERRIANVRKLEALAREFEAREGRDLRAFAQALAAGRVGAERETEAPPPAAGTGAVRLMTIHAAKGLEFDVVCLADLAHPPRRAEPALLVDGDRVGVRLPTAERTRFDALAYAALRDERRAAAAAEEERVVYVAMTRARERLILSGAARFASWPSETATAIAWLAPALVADVAQRASAGGGVAVVEGAGGVPLRLTLASADRIEELLGAAPPAPPAAPAPELDPTPAPAVAARESAPPPTGTLSYTALADYERCAYRYYLQRVLGMPEVETPGAGAGGAAERGVLVHALLQALDFARPVVPDGGEAAALAAAFVRSPLCARLAAASDIRREEPFAFLLDGALVRGFFDVAAVERDGTLLIVDYKSDRIDSGEELAARVERDYLLQRLTYALAGLAGGFAAVEVAHCFLQQPETVLAARYEASERAALEALLGARMEPLRAGRFGVSADPGRQRCTGCPGRTRLCSHEEAMTLREHAGMLHRSSQEAGP